jgi:hypothetical protein
LFPDTGRSTGNQDLFAVQRKIAHVYSFENQYSIKSGHTT